MINFYLLMLQKLAACEFKITNCTFALMPILANLENDTKNTKVVIWEIKEDLAFFEKETGLSASHKNLKRKLEHLAGRYLLKYLMPDFPLCQICISNAGKPYLKNSSLHFSISHSYPYVAVAIRQGREVGIDIQVVTDKIVRLQDKFLSDSEKALCHNDLQRLTLAWTAKEAAFKWFGKGMIDFKRHMPIKALQVSNCKAELTIDFLKKEDLTNLRLKGSVSDHFVWVYTC